jgi:hypothetical protein
MRAISIGLLVGALPFGVDEVAYAQQPPPAPPSSTTPSATASTTAPSAATTAPRAAGSAPAVPGPTPPPPGYSPGYPPPPGYAPYPYPPAAPPYGYPSPYGYPPPQPYPYPPPGYYAYPPEGYAPTSAPREVPFDEANGPPPGYHVESRARRGPIIAGASMAGSTYLVNLLVAANNENNTAAEWLYVPGVGPWVFLADDRGCKREANTCELWLIHTLTHTIGLALVVYGVAARRKVAVRDDYGIRISPARVGSGRGFAVEGRF